MKKYTRSFNGGIISPDMWGRIDDLKNNTGLAVCSNFIVLPQGPIAKRTGFRFVRETKDSSKKSRLIPFRYSASQTMMCEFGEAYIRFHSFASTLLTPTTGVSAYNSGSTYEQGDLVTESGSTWYAVADVPTSTTPSSNEYGAAPVVSATWSLTSAGNASVPSGYTFVGTALPASVAVGQKVAISRTSYTYQVVNVGTPSAPEYDIVGTETTVYDAYDGVSSSATAGYWYEMTTEYEIPSPYAESDLANIRYAQSGDVLTLTHPNYPPQELRRLDDTTWVLVEAEFGSALSAPTISAVTPTAASSPSDFQSYSYVATNVSDDQLDESVASSAVSTSSNQLFDTGAFNTITFGSSGRRNVYKLSGGLYGYIGQTTTTSLVDDNIAADVSRTPPDNQDPFASDYPRTVCYYEQRKVLAGTLALSQNFWMTKTGTESNLDRSIPVRDDDAISVKLADLESSTIRHAVPIGDLILFTDSAEWKVGSSDGGPLTPTTISVRVQSRVGANEVQPVIVGTSIVYAAARGGHLRALGYDFNVDSYVSVDLSLRARTLFDYKTIRDMAYAKGPVPIVWAVSSDGKLKALTYVPEQEVYGFHEHSTLNGVFEACAVIEEGDDSILYVIVNRTIDGSTVRYVEALASSYFAEAKEFIGLDSALSYEGSPTSTLSNLDHLEDEEVYALVDGAVQGPFTVASGQITGVVMDEDADSVAAHVGKQVISDAQTLPLVAEAEGYLNATVKAVKDVTLRLYRSGRFFVGEDVTRLTEAKIRTTESYGAAPFLRTGEVETMITPGWTDDGQIYMRSSDPLPLMITAMTAEYVTGG